MAETAETAETNETGDVGCRRGQVAVTGASARWNPLSTGRRGELSAI